MPEPIIGPEQGKRPTYSAHAVDRMFERRLPPGFVEPVLADPANEVPSERPRRRVFEGVVQGRKVRVVVVAGSVPPLVVTVVDLGRG